MRVFRRIAALAALTVTIAGCVGHEDRSSVLQDLDPAPMTGRAWSHVTGTYTGPIRSVAERGGFEGASSMETRIDLSGWSVAPEVVLRMDNGFSTAWAMYGERKGVYTNIPSKRYGSQGTVFASTHAPDQLLLQTRRFGASTGTGIWMILTFRGNGNVDVDLIGHAGWRGDGELWRVPPVMMER
jgi:hypothetical protein